MHMILLALIQLNFKTAELWKALVFPIVWIAPLSWGCNDRSTLYPMTSHYLKFSKFTGISSRFFSEYHVWSSFISWINILGTQHARISHMFKYCTIAKLTPSVHYPAPCPSCHHYSFLILAQFCHSLVATFKKRNISWDKNFKIIHVNHTRMNIKS